MINPHIQRIPHHPDRLAVRGENCVSRAFPYNFQIFNENSFAYFNFKEKILQQLRKRQSAVVPFFPNSEFDSVITPFFSTRMILEFDERQFCKMCGSVIVKSIWFPSSRNEKKFFLLSGSSSEKTSSTSTTVFFLRFSQRVVFQPF